MLTPQQTAKRVGGIALVVIVVVLVVFLLITRHEGDPTDHLEEHQPSPSPTTTGATPQ